MRGKGGAYMTFKLFQSDSEIKGTTTMTKNLFSLFRNVPPPPNNGKFS